MVGASAALQQDEQSERVATAALRAILPAWTAAGHSLQELAAAVVAALPRVSPHRRLPLVLALTAALPEVRGLVTTDDNNSPCDRLPAGPSASCTDVNLWLQANASLTSGSPPSCLTASGSACAILAQRLLPASAAIVLAQHPSLTLSPRLSPVAALQVEGLCTTLALLLERAVQQQADGDAAMAEADAAAAAGAEVDPAWAVDLAGNLMDQVRGPPSAAPPVLFAVFVSLLVWFVPACVLCPCPCTCVLCVCCACVVSVCVPAWAVGCAAGLHSSACTLDIPASSHAAPCLPPPAVGSWLVTITFLHVSLRLADMPAPPC